MVMLTTHNRPMTRALVHVTFPDGGTHTLEYADAGSARDQFDPFSIADQVCKNGRAYPSEFACDYRLSGGTVAPWLTESADMIGNTDPDLDGGNVRASHLMTLACTGAIVATVRAREVADARIARASARLAEVA